jgi:hypothetical protein
VIIQSFLSFGYYSAASFDTSSAAADSRAALRSALLLLTLSMRACLSAAAAA